MHAPVPTSSQCSQPGGTRGSFTVAKEEKKKGGANGRVQEP